MSRNKVLVVDDESGVRFGIRDFLEQHGYEIEEHALVLYVRKKAPR